MSSGLQGTEFNQSKQKRKETGLNSPSIGAVVKGVGYVKPNLNTNFPNLTPIFAILQKNK